MICGTKSRPLGGQSDLPSDFRPFFAHNFGLKWTLEATVVVRRSRATVSAAIWLLFRLAAELYGKRSESSKLLYVTGHPVGGAFPLNLICISLKFLHTSLRKTPIQLQM